MWPLSLVFSSDEQTSNSLIQALKDLEFEVESCPEIFSAVEKITSRTFDVIVSDWNEGLEAAFLLKTSRELRANHAAFIVAIADAEAITAAREAGADLILSRPIISNDVKYALLTCDQFLAHMRTWLPKLVVAPTHDAKPGRLEHNPLSVSEDHPPMSSRPLHVWASPPALNRTECVSPAVPAEPIFQDDMWFRSRVKASFQLLEPSFSSSTSIRRTAQSRLLPTIAIIVAFLSAGYVFSEPLRGQSATISVTQIYGRVIERTHAWLHKPDVDRKPALSAQIADDKPPTSTGSARVAHIRVTPVRDPFLGNPGMPQHAPQQPLGIENEEPSQNEPFVPTKVRIPESLKSPVQSASLRNVAARTNPSLLAAMEPVALPEDLSRKLLLQRILPSYPEQAVKARLQGPVVLQAWIGRDGTIQSLKLIRGSLLLGQAAYEAVRQWRYQPYLVNGRAVEAQTLVTVDFKLP